MSDTRFTLLGIGLIFAGFVTIGIVGSQFTSYTIEINEFGDCFEYSEDSPPKPINCSYKMGDKSIFFAIVISLIGAGIFCLIKGIRGKWDQKVRPEDMVGPGADRFKDGEND